MQNPSIFHPAFVLVCLGILLSGLLAWRRGLRRGSQSFSLFLFFSLFWLAAFGGRPDWPVGLYLGADPLVALVSNLAGRVLIPFTLISLAFVALAAVMGRLFCSHMCPMGALIDFADLFFCKRQKAEANRGTFRSVRKAKYVILLSLVAGALAGFHWLGWCDPIVLFTRFAAIVFYPFVVMLQDLGLDLVRPVADGLDWTGLSYLEVQVPVFAGVLTTLLLMLVLLLLGRLQPRFWCRHLCPLGGMLGWIGHVAPYRRRVSDACTACNLCVRQCPTGAIHKGGLAVDRHECIVCLQCVRICPENAVRFTFTAKQAEVDQAGPGLSRRGFIGGLGVGLVASAGLRADLLHPHAGHNPLALRSGGLIRPPGALPEPDLMARCLRCGECMRACLTNVLQPDWHRAGLEGLWAPVMNLRHAHCEYECNVCGQVCPTKAIRPLSLEEKQHAKVGTAIISKELCVAWAENRHCLMCDEACPYNAIFTARDADHKVGLPVVDPMRCAGCGTCEDKCPVIGDAAIFVVPHGEIRLSEGSYVEEAEVLGFDFKSKTHLPDQIFDGPTKPADKQPAVPAKQPDLPPGIGPADEDEDEDIPELPEE
ncbi:MAG: 4Fe-4S dicluster domain-containing protein [Deltaproteobacteria bacterium]|nr:4Fe-4S dicluster domain-containing protein [Deltaproteobacteria bacterium]